MAKGYIKKCVIARMIVRRGNLRIKKQPAENISTGVSSCKELLGGHALAGRL